MGSEDLPILVFFTRETSGPARRMESLLAHVERKERERLQVLRVDVDRQSRLRQKFAVEDAPALVLLANGKVLARIDGRANLPQIERLLAANLGERAPV